MYQTSKINYINHSNMEIRAVQYIMVCTKTEHWKIHGLSQCTLGESAYYPQIFSLYAFLVHTISEQAIGCKKSPWTVLCLL